MALLDLLFRRPSTTPCADDSKNIERRHQQREIDNAYLANQFVQQRFIFVPNEWENLSVGRVLHFDLDRGVVCHAQDYIEYRPIAFIGFPMHYNEQRLDALLKLDPFERYALCHPNPYSAEPFIKPKHSSLLSATEARKRLKSNGFFEDAT